MGDNKKYDSVYAALKAAYQPMTPKDIEDKVDKSHGSIWKEIKSMRKRGMLLKQEIKTTRYPNDLVLRPLVTYQLIELEEGD